MPCNQAAARAITRSVPGCAQRRRFKLFHRMSNHSLWQTSRHQAREAPASHSIHCKADLPRHRPPGKLNPDIPPQPPGNGKTPPSSGWRFAQGPVTASKMGLQFRRRSRPHWVRALPLALNPVVLHPTSVVPFHATASYDMHWYCGCPAPPIRTHFPQTSTASRVPNAKPAISPRFHTPQHAISRFPHARPRPRYEISYATTI